MSQSANTHDIDFDLSKEELNWKFWKAFWMKFGTQLHKPKVAQMTDNLNDET